MKETLDQRFGGVWLLTVAKQPVGLVEEQVQLDIPTSVEGWKVEPYLRPCKVTEFFAPWS